MFRSISILLLLSSLETFAQVPAQPDSTFNSTGRKVFGFGTNVLNYGDNISLQPDGKIIMTGATFDGGLGGLTKLGVCRMFPDGSMDPAFGTGGFTKVDLGTLGYNGGFEPEIALQSDGSMFINGFTQEPGTTGDDLLICKLLNNGTLDPSFGTGGKVWIDLFGGGSPDAAYAITTDASGNVYACGSTRTGGTPFTNDVAIIKLTPTGSLDPAFSGDGKLLVDVSGNWDFGYGIHVRDDGKIIVGGYAGLPANFFAVRLMPDGSYDNTFSGDGKVLIDIFGQNVADEVWGMSVDPDGKIVLVGDGIDASAGSISKGAIVRLTPDGNPDPTFSSDGIAIFDLSTSYNVLRSIVRLPDGRYVAAGEAQVNMDKDFFIVRIMNDGSPDVSFNNTGMFAMDLTGAGNDDFGYGLAIQPDQKILVSGNTAINEFSNQKYAIARIMAPGVMAAFTASSSLICSGNQVQFTNNSAGENLSYQWTFEGGSPSVSTDQNPLVTYNSTGIFDVQLIVSNAQYSDTLFQENLIEVIGIPVGPSTPSGAQNTCNLQNYTYSTGPVPFAESYAWALEPTAAGFLSPNGNSVSLLAASTWTGSYTLKVNATNVCGTSAWSTPLSCTLNHLPLTYMIQGDGTFCEGSAGAEITLISSETGVDYDLYINNVPTGNIQAGTGSPLIWQNLTMQGFYTIVGSTAYCTQSMAGQIFISMLSPPVQLTTPIGPAFTCNNSTASYTTSGGSPSDMFVWTLTPVEAGALTSSGSQATIDWTDDFTGLATLSVYAENECGSGLPSDALNIEVNAANIPLVSGLASVCLGWTVDYETPLHTGSSYAWNVTGGSIVAGSGTSGISVLWGAPGNGVVSVIETNADGCIAVSVEYQVNVDACVGNKEGAIAGIRIFPNPASSTIRVQLGMASDKQQQARILSLSGVEMFTWMIPAGVSITSADIHDLPAGIYQLEIIDAGKDVFRSRFIKM